MDVRWWKLPEPLRFVCFWAAGFPAWVVVVLILWALFEVRDPWWMVVLYSGLALAVGVGLFAVLFRVASLAACMPSPAQRQAAQKDQGGFPGCGGGSGEPCLASMGHDRRGGSGEVGCESGCGP